MRVLMLVLYAWSLLPPMAARLDAQLAYRWAMAEAIVAVTDDVEEQLTLTRIARFESDYRQDVGDCLIKGAAGDLTAWQIVPRNKAERDALCVTYEANARMALARVRESVRACKRRPPEERLALYARGNCASADGQQLSRHRYPGTKAVQAAVRFLKEEREQHGIDEGSSAVE